MKLEERQGGGTGWGHLQKYKYLQLHFPISFPPPRLTISKLNLQEKNKELHYPEGHGVKSYLCQLQHRPGGTKENRLFLRPTNTTTTSDWQEVNTWIVLSEHRPRKTKYPWNRRYLQARSSNHFLSWKLATESHCQHEPRKYYFPLICNIKYSGDKHFITQGQQVQ